MNNTTRNLPRADEAGRKRKTGGRIPLWPVIAALVFLSLLSWTASYFCAVTEADVTVPDWTVNLLSYAAEILSAARTAAMLASVACFLYAGEGIGRTAAVPAAVIFADMLIGIGSTWLSQGYGVLDPLGLVWKIVLTAAAFLIAYAMRSRFRKARNERVRSRWTRTRAAVCCALPAALLPVFFVLYDLAGHIGQRRSYTEADYQAGVVYFVGILIREILVYVLIGAAAAWLTSELFGMLPVFRKKAANGPYSRAASGTT